MPGEVRPPAHGEGGRRALLLRGARPTSCASGCCSGSARSRSRSPSSAESRSSRRALATQRAPDRPCDIGRLAAGVVSSHGCDCAQALGRLPWFAAFFLRARRLRPVLPMVFLLIETSRPGGQAAHPLTDAESAHRPSTQLGPPSRRSEPDRNRSASTHDPGDLAGADDLAVAVDGCRAATVKRCSRPSTYAADAVTSTSLPDRRWRRGARARPGCRRRSRPSARVGLDRGAGRGLAPREQPRGAEHRQAAGADGDGGVVVGDGERQRRVHSAAPFADRRSGRRPGSGDQSRSGSRTKPSRS